MKRASLLKAVDSVDSNNIVIAIVVVLGFLYSQSNYNLNFYTNWMVIVMVLKWMYKGEFFLLKNDAFLDYFWVKKLYENIFNFFCWKKVKNG